ncbi:cadherin-like protein 26 isoform X2 [Enoplosus armatus]|uniref:cadherin-like protein 26 isoform X2 n=1 Tax=Enoplosus armatus TaxID=215367 RepID=UPI00399585C4
METIHLRLFLMLCLGVHRSYSEILQRQKRNWIIDSFSIDEGYEGTFPYSLGIIEIEKDFTLFKIRGQGFDEEPKGVLKINEDTGEVTVHRPVDYEKFHIFKLTFQAFDKKKNTIDTQLGIEIQIIDSNDNPPKFDLERYEISIKESTSQGTDVITIQAHDVDSENNGKFDIYIVSVTPEPHDLIFQLTHINNTKTGSISFKGCLDHEKAEKYTIIVEAKDRGKRKQFSSSSTIVINIEDGNNHPPKITGLTGPGRVKEGKENVLVSRLQVTDKDTKGTAAWRAKYQIQGDTNNNFRITTDPETNEGLLYVEKYLDYEERPVKNLTISVENEIPSHSCQVVSRRATGLWEVVTKSGGATGTQTQGSSTRVTVTVEDVNEPPVFAKLNKQVMLGENVEQGWYLETFTATDPDITSTNTFVYIKGEDAADWVTVDPVTGRITTSQTVDRESPFVKDNIYKVTIYAVDNGKPPMTGTATLSIHITDENDNAPSLAVSTIDMCQSDGPSLANITALDLDEEPYGGPFRFKLLGEKGKWRVYPEQGFSANLVKENTVHSGHFELLLEVSDSQEKTAVHNLSVTVCNCLDTARPNCRLRKATGTAVGGGAFGIIFFAMLLLAGALLLVFLMSCKKQSTTIAMLDEVSEQHLMKCNTEIPGTDCQVDFEPLSPGHSKTGQQIQVISQVPAEKLMQSFAKKTTAAAVSQAHSELAVSKTEQQQRNYLHQSMGASSTMRTSHQDRNSMLRSIGASSTMRTSHQDRNSFYRSMGASSTMRTSHQDRNSMRRIGVSADSQEISVIKNGTLLKVLNTMLYSLQAPGEEQLDYAPHVYAEEGDTQNIYDLDAISISDIPFDPDLDLDQKFKFNTLASLCMPSETTAYSTKTSYAMEKQQLIQVESQNTKMKTQSHL